MKKKNLILLLMLLFAAVTMNAQTNGQATGNDPMKFIRQASPLKMVPVVASNRKQTLVVASLGENNTTTVGNVYLVPETFKGPYEPPRVVAVVYHDLGEDKEYCALQTVHNHLNLETGNVQRITIEQRVDDDTANIVLDIIYDRTEWEDLSNIKLLRTTAPNVASPEIKSTGSSKDILKQAQKASH